MFGPEGILVHPFGTTIDLLGNGLQFGSFFDGHFYFFLPLQHLFYVFVHHDLQFLQFLIEHFFLVRVLVAIEESLTIRRGYELLLVDLGEGTVHAVGNGMGYLFL